MNLDARTGIDLGFVQCLKKFDALRDDDEIATHVELASSPAFATDAEMEEVMKKNRTWLKALRSLKTNEYFQAL